MHLINKRFVVKIETVTEKLSLIISSTTFSDNNNRNSLFIVSFQPTRLIFPYSKLLYKNIINLRIVPYFLYYNPFNPSILIVKMERKNSNLLSTIDRIFLLHVFLIYKHNFRPSKLKLERKNCQWQYFQHFLIIITEIYCLSCQLIRLIFPYYSKFPITQKYDIKFFGRQNGTGNFEFSTKEFTENYRYLDDLGSLDQILTTTPPYLIHIKNIIFGRPLKLKLEITNFQFIFDEYKKNTDKESGESIDDLDRSDFRPRFSSNVSS